MASFSISRAFAEALIENGEPMFVYSNGIDGKRTHRVRFLKGCRGKVAKRRFNFLFFKYYTLTACNCQFAQSSMFRFIVRVSKDYYEVPTNIE
jgi:hypothetical protein